MRKYPPVRISKSSKYHNKKTEIDSITFDSKKEAKRYVELKMLEKAGVISGLTLQPKFEICDCVRWNGKTIPKKFYIADFMYTENGVEIVEDVKGMITSVYSLKRSLFLTKYPQYRFIET